MGAAERRGKAETSHGQSGNEAGQREKGHFSRNTDVLLKCLTSGSDLRGWEPPSWLSPRKAWSGKQKLLIHPTCFTYVY